jgi:hypothetical protein
MTILDVLRAWTRLRHLLRRARGGTSVLFAQAGMPVRCLASLARKEPRRPGLAAGRLTEAFFEPLPAAELAAWQQ